VEPTAGRPTAFPHRGPDLVILDVGLPSLDAGTAPRSHPRAESCTGLDADSARPRDGQVRGLRGAPTTTDEALRQPELLARVEAVLRRWRRRNLGRSGGRAEQSPPPPSEDAIGSPTRSRLYDEQAPHRSLLPPLEVSGSGVLHAERVPPRGALLQHRGSVLSTGSCCSCWRDPRRRRPGQVHRAPPAAQARLVDSERGRSSGEGIRVPAPRCGLSDCYEFATCRVMQPRGFVSSRSCVSMTVMTSATRSEDTGRVLVVENTSHAPVVPEFCGATGERRLGRRRRAGERPVGDQSYDVLLADYRCLAGADRAGCGRPALIPRCASPHDLFSACDMEQPPDRAAR